MTLGRLTALALPLIFGVTGSVAAGPTKDHSSGLAVGVGLGYQAPFLGGQVSYHQAIAPSWWVIPYGGVGVVATDGPSLAGVAGGAMVAWGDRHRIVVDAGTGTAAAKQYRSLLTGNIVEAHAVYGAVLALGYQFVARGGFWMETTLGVNYLLGDLGSDASRAQLTLNLMAGYKLW